MLFMTHRVSFVKICGHLIRKIIEIVKFYRVLEIATVNCLCSGYFNCYCIDEGQEVNIQIERNRCKHIANSYYVCLNF